MSLFSKKSKVPATPATAVSQQPVKKQPHIKPRFAALGGYDARCNDNYKHIREAMDELKIKDELVRVTDINEIASYGTMQTPAFAIDGRIMTDGRAISPETAKSFIVKSGYLHNKY